MNFFLEPFIGKMKQAYVEGFVIDYSYDSTKISIEISQSQARYGYTFQKLQVHIPHCGTRQKLTAVIISTSENCP